MSKAEQPVYLGIDIGGSALKYGWGNSKVHLKCFHRIPLTDNTLKSLEMSIKLILQAINDEIGLEQISAIGVGTPGTINRKTKRLDGVNPNLPEWVNLDPSCLFPAEFRGKLFFDNDANLMTLAEAKFAPQFTHIIGITIGSGIGCGFVEKGFLYHGAHGYAMEIGHNIIFPQGELCNCGKNGCVEAYTSVNGLLNIIRKTHSSLSLKNMNDILELSSKDIGIALLLDQSTTIMSSAIANLAINLDADLIVVGGGVVELPDYPFNILKKKILDGLSDLIKNNIVIRKAELGNKAGVMGAVFLAEQQDMSVNGMEFA
jgi:glucokinase